MPHKDPEKAREARARYYQANIEQNRERQRQYNETHREQRRAYMRQRYRANRERLSEQGRAWREANPERVRENMRRWRAGGGRSPLQRRRDEAVARLWHEQDGRCYLCERPVPLEGVQLD